MKRSPRERGGRHLEALDLHLHSLITSHCLHCHYYPLSFIFKINYHAVLNQFLFYFFPLSVSYMISDYIILDKALQKQVFKCT